MFMSIATLHSVNHKSNRGDKMKRIKYDANKELQVLYIIENLGLASIEEVEARYKGLFDKEIENCNLIVRRWKAKGALVIENGRYKIGKTPPWFKGMKTPQLMQLTKKESKDMVKDLEAFFYGGAAPIKRKRQYGDYALLTLTFENLDPILGGRPTEGEDNTTEFPREGDNFIIPPSWFYGYCRDNQGLIDVVGLWRHIAWSKGYWQGEIKTTVKSAPVVSRGKGVGVAKYETIPAHNKIIVKCRFPLLNPFGVDIEKFREWFDMITETPLRGFGANWKAYGGRIKLINIEMPKKEQGLEANPTI